MNLEFSEEQQLLSNMVERFTLDHYDVTKRADYISTPSGFSKSNWHVMAEMGLLTVPFSEEYGGLGGTAADLICVMTPLGKSVAVEPYLTTTILAGALLARAGLSEQKQKWIPKLIAGEAQIAVAHIESSARFDLEFVGTTYKMNGTGAHLNGQKTFVLGAGAADAFIVTAVAEGFSSDDMASLQFFLIDADAQGIHKRHYRLIDGSIGCELDFTNALAQPMQGDITDLHAAIALTRIGACAEMVGLMECLFEATLEHVKTREQFGRPLSKFQVIQHRLADSYANLELAKSHILRLAASHETDENYGRMVSGSKAFISKVAIALAEEAVQLHGGMGITDELIVGHAMKRILLLSNLFGDVDAEMRRFAN